MKIEAVIVCREYGDFLTHTLPENQNHLDRIVVVTHADDQETQHVCRKLGVDCLTTEIFNDYGDKFNKGKAINLGLSNLRHDDWLLHLDADIVLPHRFREMIHHARLDPHCLYGVDRFNVPSYEAWIERKPSFTPQHQYRYMVTPPDGLRLGSRLVHQEAGFCPIGFFQLWHRSVHRKYPEIAGSAEHSDVVFAMQWPRRQRVLLPELFVFHLESEPTKMGTNWQGRKTRRFGPNSKHGKEAQYGKD